MTGGRRPFTLAVPVFIFASGIFASSQAPQKPKTVWDGVYTEAQATRATGVFGASCAGCHTLTPDGNRPLSGETFWQSNTQKSVAELLGYVSKNMPNGNGGSLSPENYNDLVALILKSNGFPAGQAELHSCVGRGGPNHLEGRPGRASRQHARPRGRLSGQERDRMDTDQRDRASSNRQDGGDT